MRLFEADSIKEEDHLLLEQLEMVILKTCGGKKKLRRYLGHKLRKAIDELIDTKGTGRCSVNELDGIEKRFIAFKIEKGIREILKAPKGRLDLIIDGIDVDVKNTLGDTWMIPPEAFDMPCLLIQENEATGRFSIGLIIARKEFLTNKPNRDMKLSISTTGRKSIRWILYKERYPKTTSRRQPSPISLTNFFQV